MSEIDRLARQLAELDRRLRQLEGGQRSGLSSVEQESSNVTWVVPSSASPYDWQDDAGVTTPRVVLDTGSRVEVRASCVVDAVGVGDFTCQQLYIGVRVDTTEPDDGSGPRRWTWFSYSGDGWDIRPITFMVGIVDLEPGEHTFDLTWWAYLNSPGATQDPRVIQSYLSVTPLGWG